MSTGNREGIAIARWTKHSLFAGITEQIQTSVDQPCVIGWRVKQPYTKGFLTEIATEDLNNEVEHFNIFLRPLLTTFQFSMTITQKAWTDIYTAVTDPNNADLRAFVLSRLVIP